MRLLWILVAVVGLQRLAELVLNKRNQGRLLERGGRFVEDDAYPWLVGVHVAWFLAMAAEAILAPWTGPHLATWPLLGAYALAEALRLWTMVTLGERWTTRVIVLDGAKPIKDGPFRWLDHPIYLAVSIELVALPLAFGLVGTALVVGALNLIALRWRIRIEEEALAQAAARQAPGDGGSPG